MLPGQGVVTNVARRSVCGRDQVFWSAKRVLDCSLLKLLIAWFLKVKGHIAAARSWLSPWSLDQPPKGLWSLDSILIPIANASTRDIYVTTPCWRRKLHSNSNYCKSIWKAEVGREGGESEIEKSVVHGAYIRKISAARTRLASDQATSTRQVTLASFPGPGTRLTDTFF